MLRVGENVMMRIKMMMNKENKTKIFNDHLLYILGVNFLQNTKKGLSTELFGS